MHEDADHGMLQDRTGGRNAVKNGCKKEGMQDRRNAGDEGSRKGGRLKKRHTGKGEYRK